MPVILYKMLVAEFNGQIYRLKHHNLKDISFEKFDMADGRYVELDEDQLAEEFTKLEKYDMELLFDQ